MSIDSLFTKKYSSNYNCAHFVCDAWAVLTGHQINYKMRGFLLPADMRSAPFSLRDRFQSIKNPNEICIALFSGARIENHVGIYCKNRILHLSRSGVRYEPLETILAMGFNRVRFYI